MPALGSPCHWWDRPVAARRAAVTRPAGLVADSGHRRVVGRVRPFAYLWRPVYKSSSSQLPCDWLRRRALPGPSQTLVDRFDRDMPFGLMRVMAAQIESTAPGGAPPHVENVLDA